MVSGKVNKVTGNKNYLKFVTDISYREPQLALKMLTPVKGTGGRSPYASNLTEGNRQAFLTNINNPWFILRDLIRKKVGIVKRYAPISTKEYLALTSLTKGNIVAVSTSVAQVKYDLMVYSILINQPDVVFLSGYHFKGIREMLLERLHDTIDTMPEFIKGTFKLRIPEFVSLETHLSLLERENKIFGDGMQHLNVLILSDNIEMGRMSNSKIAQVKERIESMTNFKWLMTSLYNEDLTATRYKLIYGTGIRLDTQTICLNDTHHIISIKEQDLLYLRSDRAKAKYYLDLIKNDDDMQHYLTAR